MKTLETNVLSKVSGAGGNVRRVGKYAVESEDTGCRADMYISSDYCAKKLEQPQGTYIGPR